MGGWNLESSKWANPFKVGSVDVPNAATAVLRYWEWIQQPEQKALLSSIDELKGKILGCWCKKQGSEPCHGDVLLFHVTGTLTPSLSAILQQAGVAPPSPAKDVTKSSLIVEGVTVLDRIRAGLIGLALGDALGAPHEFKGPYEYTGRLQHRYHHDTRFQGSRTLAVGQYSDDTEMTLVLARALIRDGKYISPNVVRDYITWAASGQVMMGSNTRALLKGKPYADDPSGYSRYLTNYQKKFSISVDALWTQTSPIAEAAQSNGALMRCFPLACLGLPRDGSLSSRGNKESSHSDENQDALTNDADFLAGVQQDVWSTNPSRLAYEAEYLYLICVRMALLGVQPVEIWRWVIHAGQSPEIKTMMAALTSPSGLTWDLVYHPQSRERTRGWVVFGLYAALACLGFIAQADLSGEVRPSYSQLMAWVVKDHPGSDTDTNAAIAGALVGAILGWSALLTDPITVENIPILIASTSGSQPKDVPRQPPPYRLGDIESVVQGLHRFSSQEKGGK